jgi:hypothetical protein
MRTKARLAAGRTSVMTALLCAGLALWPNPAAADAVSQWNANAGKAAVAACISPADDPLHEIEADHGRTRGVRWGARTLDLDLIQVGTPESGSEVRREDPALAGAIRRGLVALAATILAFGGACLLAVAITRHGPQSAAGGWLHADALSGWMLIGITAIPVLVCAASHRYLVAARTTRSHARWYGIQLQLFIAAMSTAVIAATVIGGTTHAG